MEGNPLSKMHETINLKYASKIMPSVNERLGQLRPSKELLEYYRKKITECDSEQEELIKKLNSFKHLCDGQVKKFETKFDKYVR